MLEKPALWQQQFDEIVPLPEGGTKWCSPHKSHRYPDGDCKAQMASSSFSAPITANAVEHTLPLNISDSPPSYSSTHDSDPEPCAITFLTSASDMKPSQRVELLINSGCSTHTLNPCLIADLDSHTRESLGLEPPKIIYGAGLNDLLQATSPAAVKIKVKTLKVS